MLDEKRVILLLNQFERYYIEFLSHFPLTFDAYMRFADKRRASERLIQILIEMTIDIAHLIIKETKLALPSDDETLFRILLVNGIISKKLSLKLQEMKKFRNVLVHMYDDIDDKLSYRNMKQHKDFILFQQEIKEYLKKNRNNNKIQNKKV